MLWSFHCSSCFFPFNRSVFSKSFLVWKQELGPRSSCIGSTRAKGRDIVTLTHPVSPLHHISLLEQHYTRNSCSSCHLVWPWDFVRGTAQGQAHRLEKCSLFLIPRWKPVHFFNSTLFGYVNARESTLMSTFKSVWSGALVRINSFAIFTGVTVYLNKKEKDFEMQVKWEKDHVYA